MSSKHQCTENDIATKPQMILFAEFEISDALLHDTRHVRKYLNLTCLLDMGHMDTLWSANVYVLKQAGDVPFTALTESNFSKSSAKKRLDQ